MSWLLVITFLFFTRRVGLFTLKPYYSADLWSNPYYYSIRQQVMIQTNFVTRFRYINIKIKLEHKSYQVMCFPRADHDNCEIRTMRSPNISKKYLLATLILKLNHNFKGWNKQNHSTKRKTEQIWKVHFQQNRKNYASKNNLPIHLHTPTNSTYTVYVLSLA